MEKVGEWVLKLGQMTLSFGSMGTAGWIAAAVFSLVVAVGGFFLARWARQASIDEANRRTDEGRAQAGAGVPQEGRQVEQDSGQAADEIDRLSGKPPRA